MDQDQYVKQRVDDQIQWHDKKSGWNQRWFKRLQMLCIVCGASIPLITLFGKVSFSYADIVVSGLGVFVAVATGAIGLFRFQELWIDYRVTAESLRSEKFRFEAGVAPYDGEDAFGTLVERVETLLGRQNVRWQKVQKAPPKEDDE